MSGGRPLGVKLVAAFFLLDATALLVAAAIGYLLPGLQTSANNFIAHRAPFIKELDLAPFGVFLAPLIACFRAVQGLGIWFLKGWARTFIIFDLMYRLGDAAVAAALLFGIDRKMLSSIVSTPHFAIYAIAHVLILLYLLGPEAKRAFGLRDDQPD
jgi:hypothetical protein